MAGRMVVRAFRDVNSEEGIMSRGWKFFRGQHSGNKVAKRSEDLPEDEMKKLSEVLLRPALV
ncbi:MAG TPA: hypothetical protein VN792_06475, partial [Candidatus Acidoferrales bacterium]|nr:hypothetical protein [Candidatus Acidoferrales bacterium]